MDELTAMDYVTKPFMQLVQHPDFSLEVLATVGLLMDLKTSQLENLDISGAINGR